MYKFGFWVFFWTFQTITDYFQRSGCCIHLWSQRDFLLLFLSILFPFLSNLLLILSLLIASVCQIYCNNLYLSNIILAQAQNERERKRSRGRDTAQHHNYYSIQQQKNWYTLHYHGSSSLKQWWNTRTNINCQKWN